MDDPRILISCLALNYLNVFDVRVEEGLADILMLKSYVTQGMTKDAVNVNYDHLLGVYCNSRCHVDDKQYVYNSLCCDALLKAFSDDRDNLEITYRAMVNNEAHYFTGTYVRISKKDEPLRLVAGFRNVDALIAKQNSIKDAALIKGYESLSSLYLCMYRFNLSDGHYQCIKSDPFIRAQTMPAVEDFRQQLPFVMRYLAAASFHEAVMEFVDFVTLKERMQDRNTIAMEFLAIHYGWCRMRFIREDVDEEGKLKTAIFAVEVIDAEKQREISLRHLSETDQLTGLKNRATGVNEVIQLIKAGKAGFLCMIDCDKFKLVNDTYGHLIGDQVIIAVARSLQHACRSTDIVMRLGGDEFAIFAPNIETLPQAEKLWMRIFKSIDEIVIPKMQDHKIAVSLGGVFFKGDSEISIDELYHKADVAMYKSKKYEGNYATISE